MINPLDIDVTELTETLMSLGYVVIIYMLIRIDVKLDRLIRRGR